MSFQGGQYSLLYILLPGCKNIMARSIWPLYRKVFLFFYLISTIFCILTCGKCNLYSNPVLYFDLNCFNIMVVLMLAWRS